ncbi:hypothetical protein EB796_022617 [Bugula neritina]|uniref:Uncharacterized protein n=1 Tax=Bugula neritina TaxID=10212 RepID=A0A7J7IYS4_BUGNE|nr:hypothetical protein EB796_022617 [Bugula neritina]
MSSVTDLTWDHSAGENLQTYDNLSEDSITFPTGPLLNESVADDDDVIKISRRHLAFILRSLDEATNLLRDQKSVQDAARHRHSAYSSRDSTAKPCRQLCSKFISFVSRFNLLISILLQALMLIFVTIIDSTVADTHKNGTRTGPTKDKKGWTLHTFNAEKDNEVIAVSYLFLKMLYNSISSSTLCGSSPVHPDIWYNFILVALQMLLSFLYFTSILRVVINPPSKIAKPLKNNSNTLRRHPSASSLQSRCSESEQTRLINGQVNGTSYNRMYGGL